MNDSVPRSRPHRRLALLLALGLAAACGRAVDVAVDPASGLNKPASVPAGARLSDGPDLDLGFADFLDVRLVLGPSDAGDARVTFVCDRAPGVTEPQTVLIPAKKLLRDGKPHTYRLDMGLEPWWRGRLAEVRVEPGKVESLAVGDIPGDEYEIEPEQLADTHLTAPKSMESKRFRILYGAGTSADLPDEQAHGSLRNLEECWQFYVKGLKLRPPGHRDGKRYKVTITTMRGGYDAGGMVMNIHPSGLRVDPPGWVVPHELGHTFQFFQGGARLADWYEAHANYVRERWLQWTVPFQGETLSNIEPGFPAMAHWYLTHGRHYYLCWPLLAYLDENPDRLPGLGEGFVARVLQSWGKDEELYDVIHRLAPKVSLQDVAGLYARRNVAWDYGNKAAMVKNAAGWNEDSQRMVYSPLRKSPRDPAWWQSLPELSPQQVAYSIHELAPSQKRVTVNFRGFPDTGRKAGWRCSLVAVKDDWTSRYSNMWSGGPQTFELKPDEKRLYLVVAATPAEFLDGGQDDMEFPYQSHPQRQRFPYEVKLTGCAPKPRPIRAPSEPGHKHANGGGFVADAATVDATAWVGPNARVLGRASVLGGARIEDYGEVSGNATVKDQAVVSGNARVRGNAGVSGTVRVRDFADVSGNAKVSGDARFLQHATAAADAVIRDSATAEGRAEVWNEDAKENYVGGDAVLAGDYGGGNKATSGFQFGFLPYRGSIQEWIDKRTAPPGLYAEYGFDNHNDSLVKDRYGVTDGILIGKPKWSATSGGKTGVLAFDGKSAVQLERSVADFGDATYEFSIRWDGGPANQPVFWFGRDADNCLYFTPDDGQGHAALAARRGGKVQALPMSHALPAGRWFDVRMALRETDAVFTIDGASALSGAIAVSPEDFLPANTLDTPQTLFLAGSADPKQPWFRGAFDNFRVWHRPVVLGEATP